jgi:fatty acid-binding protein DegV
MELYQERVDTAKPVFVAVAHAQAPKWSEKLKNSLSESYPIAEMFECDIGPVVGAHAGPGTVGAILFQPEGDELTLLGPEE